MLSQTLTILDPTSLLGREIADGLAAELPDVRCRLFHTSGADNHLIANVGGAASVVTPLQSLDELAGSAALIVSEPLGEELAAALLDWLVRHPEVALVDASQPGIAGEQTLTVLDEAPRRHGQPRWYHLLDPSLAAPVRLLQALRAFRPTRAHLTVFRSASGFGYAAVEELAVQAAARLSGLAPTDHSALPAVVAFDLAPAGEAAQAALQRQLAGVLPDIELDLQVVEMGVFFGHAASFFVPLTEPVTERRVRTALRAGGLRLARRNQSVRPSDLADEESAMCARLRVTDRQISGWLVADGLRLAGAAAVVRIATDVMAF
mgnify:CR=1 FL=1